MRLDVEAEDRVGITHDVLAVVAGKRWDLAGVEVTRNHIYLNMPELDDARLAELRRDLGAVEGLERVTVIDVMPGERRRQHMGALLRALADPVLAVDGRGVVVVANRAAAALFAGGDEEAMLGRPAAELLGPVVGELSAGEAGVAREVFVDAEPYLVEGVPIDAPDGGRGGAGGHGGGGGALGGLGMVLILRTPARVGGEIYAVQKQDVSGFDALIGDSPLLEEAVERARRMAKTDRALLITGETGTGKELLARACHQASPRAARPFLALNCAALPENLLESELFGYAPGAFSGARRDGKPGLMELADGGTVFLDEIGEMSLYLQAKLLRFLEDGSFRRVGGQREHRVSVRVISATHRDLPAMIEDGAFREDLFYRLNVLTVAVPPLRRRKRDIPALARHFLDRASRQIGRPRPVLTREALDALSAFPWPGNVRQLENVVFRAVSLAGGTEIGVGDLDLPEAKAETGGKAMAAESGAQAGDAAEPTDWISAQAAFERALLERLYPHYPSSRKLAQRLKVSHTTIANKLRAYGVGR